jgi:hypothetical protein
VRNKFSHNLFGIIILNFELNQKLFGWNYFKFGQNYNFKFGQSYNKVWPELNQKLFDITTLNSAGVITNLAKIKSAGITLNSAGVITKFGQN